MRLNEDDDDLPQGPEDFWGYGDGTEYRCYTCKALVKPGFYARHASTHVTRADDLL